MVNRVTERTLLGDFAIAVGRLPQIAARDCRDWVREHCDVEVVAAAYERTYRSVALRGVTGELAGV